MNRSELIKTLELVKPALADNQLVPIFTNYVFHNKSVEAYNDQIGIVAPCDINATFAVSGTILLDLLKTSTSEEVDFFLKDNEVKITAGKSKLALPYFKQEDFIEWVPKVPPSVTTNLTEDLIAGIETCLITSSRDNTMPAIMGVTFNFGPKGLTLYSCDGDAITRYKVDGKIKGTGTFTATNVFCDALLKIAKEISGAEGTVSFSQDWTKAEVPDHGLTLFGRMIENPEVDHAKLIKDTIKDSQELVPVPLGFNEALSRARVIADPTTATTLVDIVDGKMELYTESALGHSSDKLNIRDHQQVNCSTHASLLQRSVAICDKIAFADNCTRFGKGDKVLVVCSNVT